MCRFIINNITIAVLLISFTGFSGFQVLAKENSFSDPFWAQESGSCYALFRDLSIVQLTEKDRVNRIEQALAEFELGNCGYCIDVVEILLKKDDLKEGGYVKVEIDSLVSQGNGCIRLLLPSLISGFDYKVPLEVFNDFSKFKKYDLSKTNIYMTGVTSWKTELINATLVSNRNSNVASQYVVDILSRFAKLETYIQHRELLRAVIKCNPLDEDIITAILSQSIEMREKNRRVTIMSDDQILPNYQAELLGLSTIVEWNKYKSENFVLVNGKRSWSFSPPIDWNWDEDGTIDFLNQLLISGFTVVDGE